MTSTDDIRALQLYELALSLVQTFGVMPGSTLKEYRSVVGPFESQSILRVRECCHLGMHDR